MDFMQRLFNQLTPPPPPSNEPATRWERAVTAFNGISKQVARIDPDGVDVYCFPGADGDVEKVANVKNANTLKQVVGAREPDGPCTMSAALGQALEEAFERGFEIPCSMLVITAGQPEDAEQVTALLQERAQQLENDADLTLTFVHVGDDADAEAFLDTLNNDLHCTSSSGEHIDMVDTVKDEKLKEAMEELKDPSFMESGGTGALIGAMSGMVLGVAGYALYSKYQAKKRTEGWNGTWEVFKQPGDEQIGVQLTVADNQEGGLTIEGYPEDDSAGNPSTEGSYEDVDEGYTIFRQGADGDYVTGQVVNEHEIEWSDDTVWREVPPEGVDWKMMLAAGAAGAAAGGAAGYLLHKKFFNKANSGERSNYVILMDCSANMAHMDG